MWTGATRARIRSDRPGFFTQMKYAIAIPARPTTAPSSRPKPMSPPLGSRSYKAESWNVGSRKWSMTCVTFGICSRPPTIARNASVPIAIFIDCSRSAMWCSVPGKPTSVSSTSPLAGFVCTSA